MNLKEYSELLDKFFQGTTSAEDNRILRDMPESDMKNMFDEYSRIKWSEKSGKIPYNVRTKMKSGLLRKLRTSGPATEKPVRRFIPVLRWTAAAACICAAAFSGYTIATTSQSAQTFEVIADKGQKSTVMLPDGTYVTLNSSSRISYSTDYNTKERTVSLSGEAYFDVARNEELPFTVKTGKMDVTALGTKFNVKAYEEEGEITATLIEGSIRTDIGEKSEVLKPNQYLILDKETGKTTKITADNPDHLVPWRNNEILFAGENLAEIALVLERMYNIDVFFTDSTARNYSYTGLIKNNSLHNILELISSTSPVKYSIRGNIIAFSTDKAATD